MKDLTPFKVTISTSYEVMAKDRDQAKAQSPNLVELLGSLKVEVTPKETMLDLKTYFSSLEYNELRVLLKCLANIDCAGVPDRVCRYYLSWDALRAVEELGERVLQIKGLRT